tara:strand:+ start:45 stop:1832 length:1788 start_codon:yes stop_codon:yes gene_type:complete
MTSYQPYGGQGNTGFGVKPVKPVVANKAIGAGIGKVVQPTLSDFLGFAPEEMNQLRQASNLPTQEEVDMQLSTQLFTPTDITAPLDTNVPAVAGISDFLSGIASRQAQTAANVAAIQGRDSDDLGTAPTKPKLTMEDYDDDLGNALNTLNVDLSQSSSSSSKKGSNTAITSEGPLGPFGGEGANINDDLSAGGSDDTTDKPYDPYGGMIEDQMRVIEALKGNDPDAKKTEDYMKEFAEATGVSIDGKADKSQALMAFGLALMQNKAGKGFDVSKALSALGEAGTAAAPAFQKAKDTARAERIAAGKYGLQQVAKDATARASSLSAAQGRLSDLMKTNIDAQTKRDLEILKGRNSFTLERFKNEATIAKAQLEAGNVDLYNTGKPESIPLFKDAPGIFKIDVFTENPNAKLKAGQEIPVKLTNATVKRMGNVFAAAERGLNSAEEEVVKLSNIINNENITPQNQLLELASSMGRAFGINVDSKLGPAAQAKYILEKIATQKAPEILNEAGKTISDADRERVTRVVGEIKAITDPQTLNPKIEEIYKLTVENGRKNLDQAYGTLHSYGHNYGPYAQQQSSSELSAEEEAELAQLKGA